MVAAFSWSSLKSATILFSTVWRVADGVLPDHGRIRLHFRGLDVDGGGGVGLRTLWRREVTLESLVAFLRVGLDIWEQRKTSD